jgi:exodeoxyribonuclease VII small subunit
VKGDEKMKDLTFEKALEKLEEIVSELEAGNLSLDSSMKKYEEGIKMARLCQEKLDKAKSRIETLSKDDSGKFVKKQFDDKSAGEDGEDA